MAKNIARELLKELLRDANRSDRQLAKILKVSQPTISRTRKKLEADLIEGYTVVPDFSKIGFNLCVLTFGKSKTEYASLEARTAFTQRMREWLTTQPNVIFSMGGEGMGWHGVSISLHKSYTDYRRFKSEHDATLGKYLSESQTFIIDLASGVVAKPYHLKYLADAV